MAGFDFRAQLGDNNTGSDKEPKPVAKYWVNFGYESEVLDEQGNKRFVSTLVGIPLGTQTKLPTNKGTQEYRAFNAARNQLEDELIVSAEKQNLQPGQAVVLPLAGKTGLAVQIRRISEETPFDNTAENPFLKGIKL